MYDQLFFKRTPDGRLRFGIRKNIDNIYEHSTGAVDEKIAISFLPEMLFPEYQVTKTEQEQFFPRPWPFTSVVYIDTLFILEPKIKMPETPLLRACELFARF